MWNVETNGYSVLGEYHNYACERVLVITCYKGSCWYPSENILPSSDFVNVIELVLLLNNS